MLRSWGSGGTAGPLVGSAGVGPGPGRRGEEPCRLPWGRKQQHGCIIITLYVPSKVSVEKSHLDPSEAFITFGALDARTKESRRLGPKVSRVFLVTLRILGHLFPRATPLPTRTWGWTKRKKDFFPPDFIPPTLCREDCSSPDIIPQNCSPPDFFVLGLLHVGRFPAKSVLKSIHSRRICFVSLYNYTLVFIIGTIHRSRHILSYRKRNRVNIQ